MAPPRVSDTIQFAGSRWTGCASAWAAWGLWAVVAVGVLIVVAAEPTRSVTGSYREAALAFTRSQPMYSESRTGWLYPIQSAMLFVPFAIEPRLLGELLWRVLGIGVFALAIRRLSARCGISASPRAMHDIFLLTTIFVFPPALSSMRNGQMNLELASLFALACADAIDRRWWRVAAWLGLALAAKPIAIVMVLLLTALHRPLWWRTPAFLAIVAAAPFAHPDWSYVLEQYRASLAKIMASADPRDISGWRPADITSLLDLVGLNPGHTAMNLVRAGAALCTLGLAWRARRLFDATTASVLALALGCAYLMLFNPRNEASTYVILGPPVAIFIAWSLIHNRASVRSIVLIILGVVFGYAQLLVPYGRELWIRPSLTLLLLAVLAAAIMAPRRTRALAALVPVAPRAPGEPGN